MTGSVSTLHTLAVAVVLVATVFGFAGFAHLVRFRGEHAETDWNG